MKTRHKLKNGDIINHPRYGIFTIKSEYRDNVIPHEYWEGINSNNIQVTPTFYSERRLHFYLTVASWTDPKYTINDEVVG